MNERNYKVDNIRFLLIFLVVFGHLLELFVGEITDTIYRMIYTFHMPAFIFITGYHARFDPKKILPSLIWPYFLFQTLYQLFYGYVIQGTEYVTLTYTTPYWLLWYLLATVFYYILIPFLQQEGNSAKVIIFALSIAVSLLAGLDHTLGYYMTLSRFLCFLPFFVAGFYCGHMAIPSDRFDSRILKGLLFLLCGILLVMSESYILSNDALFSRNVLYGSYSYTSENYTWVQRAILHITAFAWICMLFILIPNKKLPIISSIGKNTLPIFLFHGFVLRYLQRNQIFLYSEAINLCLAATVTLALLTLFGNPCSAWGCKWFFTGHWIYALPNRKNR